MSRFLHALSGVCLWIVFTVAAGTMVYANVLHVRSSVPGRFYVAERPFEASVIGAILVLLALLYAATLSRRRPKLKFVSFESDEGAVSISVHAVREFIRKLGEEFSAVISMDPKIRADRNVIHIDLDVSIQSGTRLPELSAVLQNRIRDSIRDGLGISQVRDIKVRIKEIIGAPPPDRRSD